MKKRIYFGPAMSLDCAQIVRVNEGVGNRQATVGDLETILAGDRFSSLRAANQFEYDALRAMNDRHRRFWGGDRP